MSKMRSHKILQFTIEYSKATGSLKSAKTNPETPEISKRTAWITRDLPRLLTKSIALKPGNDTEDNTFELAPRRTPLGPSQAPNWAEPGRVYFPFDPTFFFGIFKYILMIFQKKKKQTAAFCYNFNQIVLCFE